MQGPTFANFFHSWLLAYGHINAETLKKVLEPSPYLVESGRAIQGDVLIEESTLNKVVRMSTCVR